MQGLVSGNVHSLGTSSRPVLDALEMESPSHRDGELRWKNPLGQAANGMSRPSIFPFAKSVGRCVQQMLIRVVGHINLRLFSNLNVREHVVSVIK